ncbi:uncharacterized protein SETTUDRAFT_31760 [Exserohilum turcica Et28A]|uniref:Uncharacterized protein n=1 Tax=Exserohilum turcicum (strain 28A) TaxID=671987 RepID=R0K4N0_EXST2|nr:uncharacterized protein SETTUDRAFT_31760 [Exserohilum turcica Et28A]EOA84494.1 hypothetical protein SETTUDRAFT_31760 [Exserohilum turcica Et28A]
MSTALEGGGSARPEQAARGVSSSGPKASADARHHLPWPAAPSVALSIAMIVMAALRPAPSRHRPSPSPSPPCFLPVATNTHLAHACTPPTSRQHLVSTGTDKLQLKWKRLIVDLSCHGLDSPAQQPPPAAFALSLSLSLHASFHTPTSMCILSSSGSSSKVETGGVGVRERLWHKLCREKAQDAGWGLLGPGQAVLQARARHAFL